MLVRLLVQSSLLLHRDASTYWFGIPDSGLVYDSMQKARKKIVQMLKREKFQELPESVSHVGSL